MDGILPGVIDSADDEGWCCFHACEFVVRVVEFRHVVWWSAPAELIAIEARETETIDGVVVVGGDFRG